MRAKLLSRETLIIADISKFMHLFSYALLTLSGFRGDTEKLVAEPPCTGDIDFNTAILKTYRFKSLHFSTYSLCLYDLFKLLPLQIKLQLPCKYAVCFAIQQINLQLIAISLLHRYLQKTNFVNHTGLLRVLYAKELTKLQFIAENEIAANLARRDR